MTPGSRASGTSASREISARTTPEDDVDHKMSVAPRAAAASATCSTPDFSKDKTTTRIRDVADGFVAASPTVPLADPSNAVDAARDGVPSSSTVGGADTVSVG